MAEIRRLSPVEVGSWNPIIYQVFIHPRWATKKKTAWLSIEYCLINRDPYGMVYEIIPI